MVGTLLSAEMRGPEPNRQTQTHAQMDIVTYRLNLPNGWLKGSIHKKNIFILGFQKHIASICL